MFLMVSIKENVVFWFFDFRPLRVPNGATKFWEIRKNALGQGSSDADTNKGYQKVFMSF